MILIGQFDSPFVRRIGVTLELYGFSYEHRPWSTFGDADKIAPFNPLMRVPTLVFDDGVVMADTHPILFTLDAMVQPERRLTPADANGAREVWRLCGFISGVSDKAVQLFYVNVFAGGADPVFTNRLRAQIAQTMDLIEGERAARNGDWWMGAGLTHADIALGAMYRHFSEAYAGKLDFGRWPAIQAHSARCEALPVFQKIFQPFIFTEPKED
ncbi:MAG: glutathione S-transferase family protein [Hyphomonadaceae bacterium]|nr:glutathione S-transferase family protein [Hyphomonadaceae bacterium]